MKETYKGYKITYGEYTKKFEARIDSSTYEHESLEKVRKHIDNLDRKNFKRFRVLTLSGWSHDKFSSAIVTSIDKEREQAWVRHEDDKRRERLSFGDIALDTPENRAIRETIKQAKKELDELRVEISQYYKSLERYKATP